MPSVQGFAAVNGANLYYETVGAGEPLVLVHAGIADSRMWDDQLAEFARRYRVVRYDLRGFGRSMMPFAPYSHVADLAGLLEWLGVERAILVGASMGGATAIDLAVEQPALVAALVLVAPGLSGYPFSEDMLARDAEVDAALARGGVAAAIEQEQRVWVDGPGRTPEQVDPVVRERVRAMNTDAYAATNQGAERQRPARPANDRLAEIRAPTLVIVGAGDVPDMLAVADRLAAGIDGARKTVLPDLAHLPNMEAPANFNRLVLDFLQEVGHR